MTEAPFEDMGPRFWRLAADTVTGSSIRKQYVMTISAVTSRYAWRAGMRS
jgi:hypothetical protein